MIYVCKSEQYYVLICTIDNFLKAFRIKIKLSKGEEFSLRGIQKWQLSLDETILTRTKEHAHRLKVV